MKHIMTNIVIVYLLSYETYHMKHGIIDSIIDFYANDVPYDRY